MLTLVIPTVPHKRGDNLSNMGLCIYGVCGALSFAYRRLGLSVEVLSAYLMEVDTIASSRHVITCLMELHLVKAEVDKVGNCMMHRNDFL